MFRSVQTAITSVSFPKTLEELRKMGTKWLGMVGKDWITDLDVLLHFPSSGIVTWIAPKWLTAGDLLFFYHTKTARGLIRNLLAEAYQIRLQPHTTATPYTKEEIEKLVAILQRIDGPSRNWTGKIFAVGEVSGRPQRMFDENKHFKGTIYAPLASVSVFERPISSEEFNPFLKIGQNTVTPVYGDQFSQLKELIAKYNNLPGILAMAVPGDLNFRDVDKDNWITISCRKGARFINEAQLRAYLLDYLLPEIKDSRSPIHAECNCYRHNERTGIADYFIRFNNKWIPVEAKLNILAEQDLRSQLAKYTHLDRFSPTLGSSIGVSYPVDDESRALVFDQSGMYVTHNGEFINCSRDKPLIKREDIQQLGTTKVREQIIKSL